jgi:hypothetical protein
MKYVKLFEEFRGLNEAQETLRKKLGKIHKSNPSGMGEESSMEHAEELEKSHSDKKKEIKKFFSLMADLEEANDELQNSGGKEDDDESEELEKRASEIDSSISDLITKLG